MPLGVSIKKQTRNINQSALFKKKTDDRVSDKGAKKPEAVEKQLSTCSDATIALSIASISGSLQLDPNNFSDSVARNNTDITVDNSYYTDVFRDINRLKGKRKLVAFVIQIHVIKKEMCTFLPFIFCTPMNSGFHWNCFAIFIILEL